MGNQTIPNRQDWLFVLGGKGIDIYKDKERVKFSIVMKMMSKTQRIFEYKNLPESLPAREIELILQTAGFTIWKKVDGKLYVFYGGLGGIPNAYYLPTQAIVTNPFLKYYDVLDVDENCVVMWNDSMHMGLCDLNDRYASLIAECEVSLRLATVNARIPAILNVNSDTDKETALKYLKDVEDGNLAVLMTDDIVDTMFKVQDYNNKSITHIKELIEEHQYLYAKWWNELGVNANYNMKREAINESEASMNEDALLPLLDDMLENRKLGLEKVNKMFGTNIEVDFTSSWKKLRKDIDIAQEVEEAQADNNEPNPDETPEEEKQDEKDS